MWTWSPCHDVIMSFRWQWEGEQEERGGASACLQMGWGLPGPEALLEALRRQWGRTPGLLPSIAQQSRAQKVRGVVWGYMTTKSASTLAQVMACCLTAPSHYRNQCWLNTTKVPHEGWFETSRTFHLDSSECISCKWAIKFAIKFICLKPICIFIYA